MGTNFHAESDASRRWWRGLEARALMVVAVGSAVVFGAALGVSQVIADRFEDSVVGHLAGHASVIAALAQQELDSALSQAAHDSTAADATSSPPRPSGEVFGDLTFEFDGQAGTIRASPSLAGQPELRRRAVQLAARARSLRLPVVSEGLVLPGLGAGVILVKAAHHADGSVWRYRGAFLDAAHANALIARESAAVIGADGELSIIDRNGRRLSEVGRALPESAARHMADLSAAIGQRRTFVGRCHECHPAQEASAPVDEILAAAAMPDLDLGVVIRQPVARVLTPVDGLRRGLLVGAALVVAMLAIIAALAIRGVATKVRLLVRSVRRLDSRAVGATLPAFGDDELGTLALAIDHWRAEVARSVAVVDSQQATLREQIEATNRLLASLLSVAESSLHADNVQQVVDNGLKQLCGALGFSSGTLRIRHDMAEYTARHGQGPAAECDAEQLVSAELGRLPDRPLPQRAQERMTTLLGPQLSGELRGCDGAVTIMELVESQGFVASAVLKGQTAPTAIGERRLHNMLHHVLLAATARLFSRHERLLQDRRRALLRRVLRAQEDERLRIARELHDTVCQDLAALSLHLERLARRGDVGELSEPLSQCQSAAHGMLETVRRISHDLRPTVLDTMGFLPALQWHIERIHRGEGLRADLVIDGQPYDLSEELALTLYRIVQECLNNVAQHASAAHVCVTVAFQAENIAVAVEDDGVGFERRAELARVPMADGRGLGLLGIEERAKMAGGRCAVDSEPGQGATITVKLPRVSGASLREAS